MNETMSECERSTALSKKTTVTVTAKPLTAAPWVEFFMDAKYPNKGGKQEGENLKFDKLAGAFDVEFDLIDDTKLNLAFYPDFADAIWVEAGTSCPLTQAGNGNGAILPGKVSAKKLAMTNMNTVPETLTFMLRFTGNATDAKHPPYVYDPRIINGGDPPLGGEDDDGQDVGED